MTGVALRCESLGKRYRRGERLPYLRFSDSLARAPRAVLERIPGFARRRGHGHGDHPGNEWFWAVRDVDLEVEIGQVIGIIGRNGAGKSTLLKLLSRITEPTAGRAMLYGRVGSLLEVGTGFHPELTGRENIFLNGTVLGMTRREILSRFDEIVTFAGVEDFLDTPVKRFSSGMQTRLGFAVAAHLNSEILIVDEVLAVGDAAFQRKCLGKMESVSRSGRSILFVSHNMAAIRSLCHRVLHLDQGRVVADGAADEVVDAYLGVQLGSTAARWIATAPLGEPEVRLLSCEITTEDPAQRASAIRTNGQSLLVSATIEVTDAPDLSACIPVHRTGELAFLANTYHASSQLAGLANGRYTIDFVIPPYLLNPGRYSFGLHIATIDGHRIFIKEPYLVSLDIEDDGVRRGGTYFGPWPGPTSPLLEWKVSRAD